LAQDGTLDKVDQLAMEIHLAPYHKHPVRHHLSNNVTGAYTPNLELHFYYYHFQFYACYRDRVIMLK
jgi:hypothetical protein